MDREKERLELTGNNISVDIYYAFLDHWEYSGIDNIVAPDFSQLACG